MTNKELLKELKKRIRKGYGRKCTDFNYSCFNCQIYVALEILEDALYEK